MKSPFRPIPTAALAVMSNLHWLVRWFPSCDAEQSDIFGINSGLLSTDNDALGSCHDACKPTAGTPWALEPALGA